MKKFFKIFSLVLCFALLISGVKAATREELLEYMPEAYLDSLSVEEYNKLLTLDVSKAVTNEKTYKDNKYPEGISPMSPDFWETTYKKIKVSAIPYGDGIDYNVSVDLQWKYIPAVTSFDVIAVRFDNLAYNPSVARGNQYYTLKSTGASNLIGYSANGTNIVKKNNGFGISMNIVDDPLTDLRCFISVDAAIASSTGTIYGAYEHAVRNVTLAQSQNYNISYAGMGRVINFAESVWDNYDDMDGVYINVSK